MNLTFKALKHLVPIPSEVFYEYISPLPIKVSLAVGVTHKLMEPKPMMSISI